MRATAGVSSTTASPVSQCRFRDTVLTRFSIADAALGAPLPPADHGVVVVRPAVDDAVRDVVMGQVLAVDLAERELQDLHAGKAERREKLSDVVRDLAEVLRDDRDVSERMADRLRGIDSPIRRPS